MRRKIFRKKKEDITFKEYIKVFGPAMVIAIVGFIIAYQFVAPAPPRNIVIGTGGSGGAYYSFGKKYQEILKKNGIALEVRQTAGSVENIQLLEKDKGGVDIAFIQGGTGSSANRPEDIIALGSLNFEPMWIFYRPDLSIKRLPDLKGMRVSVGEVGSGTRALSIQLLDLNGVNEQNTRFISSPFEAVYEGLKEGVIDVIIYVAYPNAEKLGRILDTGLVSILGIERPHAYAIRFHYLNVLTLPEGTVDFVKNNPPEDIHMLGPTMQLVARADLHPALVGLLLQAAERIHGSGRGFEEAGQFPAPINLDFRLSNEARRYYKSGPTFLQRYLPFWIANFIARMTVMLLPLFALLFPLFKMMPAIYRWRMRSKIYRWYSRLEEVDPEIQQIESPEQLDELVEDLDRIEHDVSRINIPLAYTEALYQLRLHIDMLRKKIRQAQENQQDH